MTLDKLPNTAMVMEAGPARSGAMKSDYEQLGEERPEAELTSIGAFPSQRTTSTNDGDVDGW
jgi:hypothetical protein